MTETRTELVEVRLLEVPLDVLARARERKDGLTREFALIATSLPSDAVPARLLRLARDLRSRYGGHTMGPQEQIDNAMDRGEQSIDVAFTVPAAARHAAVELLRVLDEADDFCRSGDLLMLAAPPELVRFRQWYLGEFIRQIDGEPPTPWPEWRRAGTHLKRRAAHVRRLPSGDGPWSRRSRERAGAGQGEAHQTVLPAGHLRGHRGRQRLLRRQPREIEGVLSRRALARDRHDVDEGDGVLARVGEAGAAGVVRSTRPP